jgi:putative transposase
MKKHHFTETQIFAAIQKQEKSIVVKDIVREMGASEQTFYNRKAKYGVMQASDIKKLRDMESELSAYKKLVGELEFENRAMKTLIEKSCRAC